jgi:hypothetical protein
MSPYKKGVDAAGEGSSSSNQAGWKCSESKEMQRKKVRSDTIWESLKERLRA